MTVPRCVRSRRIRRAISNHIRNRRRSLAKQEENQTKELVSWTSIAYRRGTMTTVTKFVKRKTPTNHPETGQGEVRSGLRENVIVRSTETEAFHRQNRNKDNRITHNKLAMKIQAVEDVRPFGMRRRRY
jgi:hypothetical protein